MGAQSFSDALVMVRNVYYAMGEILADRGASTLVADEGGLAPAIATSETATAANEAAVRLLVQAIEKAGYRPGEDAAIGLDVAATHFYQRWHCITCTPRIAYSPARRWCRCSRSGSMTTRSFRLKTVWRKMTGTAGRH